MARLKNSLFSFFLIFLLFGTSMISGDSLRDTFTIYLPFVETDMGIKPIDPEPILFHSDYFGTDEILSINHEGSNIVRITNDAFDNFTARWSPDKQKIVYTSKRDGNYEIIVMNADGSGQTNISNHPAADSRPTWSPDGTKIAFMSTRNGIYQIFVIDADGSNLIQITESEKASIVPFWSPDGAKIAFSRRLEKRGELDIFTVPASGGQETQLTDNSYSELVTDWSNNGEYLLVQADFSIHMVKYDGTSRKILVRNALSAKWNDDNTQIIFVSDERYNSDLYLIDADGNNQTQITFTEEYEWSPDW